VFQQVKIYNFLIPLLFFAIGISNVGKDLFGTKLNHYPGDLVDSRFNNAILEHDYRWLRGWNADLWDPPFFVPAKNMLAASDNHLGTFGFYAAFRITGMNEFRSFQAWIFVLFVLNFVICFYVLRQFGFDIGASSLGAFIFSFSMPVVGQLFHIQTLCKFSVPFVFLYLKKWIDSEKIKHLAFFLISWVYLMYCSIYFGLLILPFIILFFVFHWFQKTSFFKNFDERKIFISISLLFLSATILIPLISHYSQMGNLQPKPFIGSVNSVLPGPLAYITPVYGNFWWSQLSLKLQGYDNAWLLNFFPGILPLGMFFILFFSFKKAQPDLAFMKSTQFILIISILLFTTFFGYSLYQFMQYLPGYEHLKVVSRFYLITLFFFAISIAFFWKLYVSKKSTLVQIAFAVLFVAEQINVSGTCSYIDYDFASKHHLTLVDQINASKSPEKSIFVLLRPKNTTLTDQVWQLDAMIASLTTGLPTLNGYTTATPPNFELINISGDSAGVKQWLLMNNWDSVDVFKEVIICTYPSK
jgi:hypothetical protein